jgi:hypothetical protein
MVLFADDTTVSAIGSNYIEVERIIVKDLEVVNEWLAHNKLIVNWLKNKHMVLGSDSNGGSSPLSINNHLIDLVDNVKLLGVEIDSQLKQIKAICSKVNRKAFILSRRFYLFNRDFKTILFKLFILPHFDYCSTLFCFNNCSILSKCYSADLLD